MASREEAEEALYDAIIEGAKSAGEQKDGSVLKAVAESYSQVAHGPSGGQYDLTRENNETTKTTSNSSNTTKHETKSTQDFHETHHADGDAKKTPTGFGDDKAG